MRDPVICMDGYSYERQAIEHHLFERPRGVDAETGRPNPPRSPMTNADLVSDIVTPNIALRNAIRSFCESYPDMRIEPPEVNLQDVKAAVESMEKDGIQTSAGLQEQISQQQVEIQRLTNSLRTTREQNIQLREENIDLREENALLCEVNVLPHAPPGQHQRPCTPAAATALAASAFAVAPPGVQKEMIGEQIYPFVARHLGCGWSPPLTGKVTGMMLELDNSVLLELIGNEERMKERLDEAYRALQSNTVFMASLQRQVGSS